MHVVTVHSDAGDALKLCETRPRRKALPAEFGRREWDLLRLRSTIELIYAAEAIEAHGRRKQWPRGLIEAETERLLGQWAKDRGLRVCAKTLASYRAKVNPLGTLYNGNLDRRGKVGRPKGPGCSPEAWQMFVWLLKDPRTPSLEAAWSKMRRAARKRGWRWYTTVRTARQAADRWIPREQIRAGSAATEKTA